MNFKLLHAALESLMSMLGLYIGWQFWQHYRSVSIYLNAFIAFGLLASSILLLTHGWSYYDNGILADLAGRVGVSARYLLLFSFSAAGLGQIWFPFRQASGWRLLLGLLLLSAMTAGFYSLITGVLLPSGFSPLVMGIGLSALIFIFQKRIAIRVNLPTNFQYFMVFGAAGYFWLAFTDDSAPFGANFTIAHTLWLCEYISYLVMLLLDGEYMGMVKRRLKQVAVEKFSAENGDALKESKVLLDQFNQLTSKASKQWLKGDVPLGRNRESD